MPKEELRGSRNESCLDSEALDKLTEIEKFIAQDNPQRAETFVNHLIERGESLAQNPQIGRIVPELSIQDIREIMGRKYRMVYRVRQESVEILTVFEGHRFLRPVEIGFL